MIFNFPYHRVSTDYPESSTRIKLGGSYEFTAPPVAPDRRVFILSFPVLTWYGAAGQIDITTNPELNLGRLEAFYNTHKTNLAFTYPHPIYGNLRCRFNKPLRIPEGTPGGGGAVHGFSVEFIETPGA